MPSDEALDDTVRDESKIIDEEPKIEEEKAQGKENIKIKDEHEATYSAILAATDEDDWNLFELPQFNEESMD